MLSCRDMTQLLPRHPAKKQGLQLPGTALICRARCAAALEQCRVRIGLAREPFSKRPDARSMSLAMARRRWN